MANGEGHILLGSDQNDLFDDILCVMEAEVWREVEFLVVITNYHKAVKQSQFHPKSEGHLSAARRQLAN